MKSMFYLITFIACAIPLFGHAQSSLTKSVNCMPPGDTGVFLEGEVVVSYKKLPSGAVKTVGAELSIEKLEFFSKGIQGSQIKNFKASTLKVQEGNDVIVADFPATTSPRIKKIKLKLTPEGVVQSDSYVVTSKGNRYDTACTTF